jgi:hypothetical protein
LSGRLFAERLGLKLCRHAHQLTGHRSVQGCRAFATVTCRLTKCSNRPLFAPRDNPAVQQSSIKALHQLSPPDRPAFAPLSHHLSLTLRFGFALGPARSVLNPIVRNEPQHFARRDNLKNPFVEHPDCFARLQLETLRPRHPVGTGSSQAVIDELRVFVHQDFATTRTRCPMRPNQHFHSSSTSVLGRCSCLLAMDPHESRVNGSPSPVRPESSGVTARLPRPAI